MKFLAATLAANVEKPLQFLLHTRCMSERPSRPQSAPAPCGSGACSGVVTGPLPLKRSSAR